MFFQSFSKGIITTIENKVFPDCVDFRLIFQWYTKAWAFNEKNSPMEIYYKNESENDIIPKNFLLIKKPSQPY